MTDTESRDPPQSDEAALEFLTNTGFRLPFDLPSPVRASYEKRMAHCRRIWEAIHDPLAVAEAITLAHHFRQPIEPWLEAAAVQELAGMRSEARIDRHRLDMKHFHRWRFLRDLKGDYVTTVDGRTRWVQKRKPSWNRARELVAERLDISTESVERSYNIVQDDIEAGRGDKYFILKDRRYRDQELG